MHPQVLRIEEQEKTKPLFLLYGNTTPLLPLLIDTLNTSASIVLSTNTKHFHALSIAQYLPVERLGLLGHVKDVFSFAVLFLDESLSQHAVLNLLEKLKHDNAKVAVIISVRDLIGQQTIIRQLKQYDNIMLLLLGDLYGPTISENYSKVSKIIQNGLIRRRVSLSENSLEPVFPMYSKDALQGIQYALFRARKHAPAYFLYYDNPQTTLSMVNLLRRVEPELEIANIDHKGKGPISSINTHAEIEKFLQTVFHTPPRYISENILGFEKSILTLHTKHENIEKHQQTKRLFRFIPRKLPTPPPSAWSFLASLILGVILYHAVVLALLGWHVHSVQKALTAQNYTQALQSGKNFASLYPFIQPQLLTIAQSIHNKGFDDGYTTISFVATLLQTDNALIDLLNTQKIPDSYGAFSSVQAEALSTYFFLQQQRAENIYIKNVVDNTTQSKLNYLATQSVLPEVLGYHEKKTYLLLFHNNGELRPSGGFIGSVGIATIEDGAVEDLEIHDVYDIDGQLKAHVEPHFIVRRFLQPHLYLRDSSFSLSFEESASSAATLYNLAMKKQVDGVIGVDFEAVRQLIEKTGPIYLPEYDKTIDAGQAFDFLQDTIESNFFPGSSQKRDVLKAVYNQLFLKLTENTKDTSTAVALVPDLIAEKHIMMAFADPTIQRIFTVSGMSGSLEDLREKKEDTLYDVVGVNEANIGVNKANADVTRLVEHEVFLNHESIEETTTLHLVNTAKEAVPYQSYIRLVTPTDSSLAEILIDDKVQSIVPAITNFSEYEKKSFQAPEGLEVDEAVIRDKKTYGFRVLVQKDSTQTIRMKYTRKVTESKKGYNLWYIKQPGTIAYPLTITIRHPQNSRLRGEGWNQSESAVTRQEVISKDRVYELRAE
jgi:hypothetical protein